MSEKEKEASVIVSEKVNKPVVRVPKWLWWVVAAILLVKLLGLIYVSWYVRVFSSVSGVEGKQIGQIARETLMKVSEPRTGRFNLVLVGADEERRSKGGILTDTIVLTSINFDGRKVTTISIPRDAWLSEWKTKINAIYYYGEKESGKTGAGFLESELGKVTGLGVNSYILVTFETLKSVVDAVGGVEIDVPEAFVDEKFPIPENEVDRSVPTPTIYETVKFEGGKQVMDGETALKYVRSRQSENEEEGSDVARERRQQQVISALATKLARPEVWGSPRVTGGLYRVWREQVKSDLSESEILNLGYRLWRGNYKLSTLVLPTEGNEVILVNPPVRKYGQWVFEPKGGDWEVVREYIGKNLQ